jgi:hypothetical protein
MEFLEGDSLRKRVTQGGPLPLEQALRVARQMALALAAAHERGIVHRDRELQNRRRENTEPVNPGTGWEGKAPYLAAHRASKQPPARRRNMA